MILLLDDDQDRYNALVKNVGPTRVTWATTADEALAFLSDMNFDVIMLDHNLGTIDTGCKVAEFIASNAERFMDTAIVIHSSGTHGVAKMNNLLKAAGITPEVNYLAIGRVVCRAGTYYITDPLIGYPKQL